MIRFSKKVDELKVPYIPSAVKLKYDKRKNKLELSKENPRSGRIAAAQKHYKKINKKLGGTLTPKKKKTPKNIPKTKRKIRQTMKDIAEDVDEANEIRKRLAEGEEIPRGRRNTAMGYAYEKEMARRSYDLKDTNLRNDPFIMDSALKKYHRQFAKSMARTIRKT